MSARVPFVPSDKSLLTSLASRPHPPSLSRFRPTSCPLLRLSVQAAHVKAEGPSEGEKAGGAAGCCRRCFQGEQGWEARYQPRAAWTPPLRLTAVTATIAVSHLKVMTASAKAAKRSVRDEKDLRH